MNDITVLEQPTTVLPAQPNSLNGMTTIKDEIFIARYSISPYNISVYDAKTYVLKRSFIINNVVSNGYGSLGTDGANLFVADNKNRVVKVDIIDGTVLETSIISSYDMGNTGSFCIDIKNDMIIYNRYLQSDIIFQKYSTGEILQSYPMPDKTRGSGVVMYKGSVKSYLILASYNGSIYITDISDGIDNLSFELLIKDSTTLGGVCMYNDDLLYVTYSTKVMRKAKLSKPFYSSFLLQSNNKIYSLKELDEDGTWYRTKMTSDTDTAPLKASASSVYNSSYPAWRAFDGIKGDTTSRWASSALPARISLDFGKNTKVNFVELNSSIVTNGTNNNEHPRAFAIQGSNDGQNWIDIAYIENSKITKANQLKKYYTKFSNYRFYSLYIKASNNSTSITTIGEITFGFDNVLTEIPVLNKNNLTKYGSYSLDNLNGIYDRKSYLLQDGALESSGDIRKSKLDRKPLSISFK